MKSLCWSPAVKICLHPLQICFHFQQQFGVCIQLHQFTFLLLLQWRYLIAKDWKVTLLLGQCPIHLNLHKQIVWIQMGSHNMQQTKTNKTLVHITFHGFVVPKHRFAVKFLWPHDVKINFN